MGEDILQHFLGKRLFDVGSEDARLVNLRQAADELASLLKASPERDRVDYYAVDDCDFLIALGARFDDRVEALAEWQGTIIAGGYFGWSDATPLAGVAERRVTEVVREARKLGVHPGYALGRDYEGMDDVLLVALTEKRTPADIDRLAEVLGEVCG